MWWYCFTSFSDHNLPFSCHVNLIKKGFNIPTGIVCVCLCVPHALHTHTHTKHTYTSVLSYIHRDVCTHTHTHTHTHCVEYRIPLSNVCSISIKVTDHSLKCCPLGVEYNLCKKLSFKRLEYNLCK